MNIDDIFDQLIVFGQKHIEMETTIKNLAEKIEAKEKLNEGLIEHLARKLINDRLFDVFGANYEKLREFVSTTKEDNRKFSDKFIALEAKVKNDHDYFSGQRTEIYTLLDKSDKLEKTVKSLSESFSSVNKGNAENSQKITELQSIIKSQVDAIVKLNAGNNDLARKNEQLETRVKLLSDTVNTENSQKISELESKIKSQVDAIVKLSAGNNDLARKNEQLETTVKALSDIVKNLKRDIDECQQKNTAIESKQTSFYRSLSEKERINSKPESARAGNDNNSLSDGINNSVRYTTKLQEAQTDSIINQFNQWAANPTIMFPAEFYFVSGEFRIRTRQELEETNDETKWITNRSGGKNYLFPNPNSFDQTTDILELYRMDQTKLKPKGQNKIRIIKVCEMTKDGFIEFQGELELLP
jgi:myosin heavy subunit